MPISPEDTPSLAAAVDGALDAIVDSPAFDEAREVAGYPTKEHEDAVKAMRRLRDALTRASL